MLKSKIFKRKMCDLKVEVIENGWANIIQDDDKTMSLGKYPNKRWEVIEEALNYVKKGEKK